MGFCEEPKSSIPDIREVLKQTAPAMSDGACGFVDYCSESERGGRHQTGVSHFGKKRARRRIQKMSMAAVRRTSVTLMAISHMFLTLTIGGSEDRQSGHESVEGVFPEEAKTRHACLWSSFGAESGTRRCRSRGF